jgi:hypothetical protein
VASRLSIFGRPTMLGLHSIFTLILCFILLLSCSLHGPKTSEVKQIPCIHFQSFIYLFIEKIDFILCNDEINMLWKMSK